MQRSRHTHQCSNLNLDLHSDRLLSSRLWYFGIEHPEAKINMAKKKQNMKCILKTFHQNAQLVAMNRGKLFIKPEHRNLLSAILRATSYTKRTKQPVPGT